jgi:hypothetical protein
MLEINALSKNFGGIKAINNVEISNPKMIQITDLIISLFIAKTETAKSSFLHPKVESYCIKTLQQF